MKYLALLLVAVLMGGGIYQHYFYPPVIKERAAEQALQVFVKAVATKDRAKISDALHNYFTDDAKIHLSFGFFSIGQDAKMTGQDFTRGTFIGFIDNVLYSLTDYSYEASITQFDLSSDQSEATVMWRSFAWGDGASYYGGVGVDMRFSGTPECSGKVSFKEAQPKLSEADCKLILQAVPKPGQEKKLQENPGALGSYLR